MESEYVHSSKVQPYVIPTNSLVDPAYIQRATEISLNPSVPMEDDNELGSEGSVAVIKKAMEAAGVLTVKEYARLALWSLLSGKVVSGDTEISIRDLKEHEFDVVVPYQDNDGKRTVDILPRCNIASFALAVPVDDRVMQTWNFGQASRNEVLANQNTHVLVVRHTVTAGDVSAGNFALGVSPGAIAGASRYPATKPFLRVTIESGGAGGEQTDAREGTSGHYTYSGGTVTEQSSSFVENDVWTFVYTANTGMAAYARVTSYPDYILGDGRVECYLINEADPYNVDTHKLLRLQNAGFTTTITSEVQKEIGNNDKVIRMVTNFETSIDLGKNESDVTTLAKFCGIDPTTGGLVSIEDIIDNLVYEARIWDNKEHTGAPDLRYRVEGLTVPSANKSMPVNALVTGGFTVRSTHKNCLLVRNY